MTDAEFVILGAGPAGLGAAYRLASCGFRVIVLERGERVGGLAASFEAAGQSVDYGSRRLHAAEWKAARRGFENHVVED